MKEMNERRNMISLNIIESNENLQGLQMETPPRTSPGQSCVKNLLCRKT